MPRGGWYALATIAQAVAVLRPGPVGGGLSRPRGDVVVQRGAGYAESLSLAEQAAQADLIRDLFGNPFRLVTLDPAWRSADVLSLAEAAYDNRALPEGTLGPARLALLADALEDAGCSNAEVLTHLRGPGPHVRGCWAVDAVLGKS
jgi:hypothetical protein